MAAGGSYFQSRLGGGSLHSVVGGGGAPPVSTKKASFKTTDKHYALKLNAYNRALRNAAKKRAAASKKKTTLGGGPGSFAGINFAAPQAPAQEIINPFPQVLKGVAADTKSAKGQVSRGRKEAERALKSLGVGGGGVAGAGVSDIYAGGISGIDTTSRGIRSNINTEAQKFILQQIQQRQQFQMEQMQRNQITPDTLRQLVASGINPSSVNLSDPYAVAMALGQAQASGGSGGGLSFGQIASLAQAGIDPDLYRDDPYGAAKALGKSKRTQTTPKASDIAALLKAAQ